VPIMPRVSAQARVPQELLATSPHEAADGDVDIVATLTPTGDLLPSRHPRLGACYAALVFSAIALYTLAAALLTVVPGPDNALLLRNALRGGRSYALASAVGCAIGLVCWGLVAAFGLTALVTASRVGYNVLRVAGAVYLVWLGLRMWRSAGAEAPVATHRHRGGVSNLTGFRLGLLTDLLNPKAAVFFVSFLPQFIPAGSNVFAMTVLYGVIQALLMVVWGALVVALVEQLRRLLASAAVRRRLERVAAALMVGFGLRLALEHR
jgi:threonine/homoserine/homoserine lactone efflux protein